MSSIVAKFSTMKDRFANKIPVGAKSEELTESFLGKNILFYIERSNNHNAVVYEANMNGDKLDEKDPVKVYWIMYAKSTVNEEGLTMIERNTAYGSTCTKNEAAGEGHYKLVLSAMKDKVIDVAIVDGVLSATTEVNGEPEQLVHIFVQSTTSWGMPKVQHLDITGRKADGSLTTERKPHK